MQFGEFLCIFFNFCRLIDMVSQLLSIISLLSRKGIQLISLSLQMQLNCIVKLPWCFCCFFSFCCYVFSELTKLFDSKNEYIIIQQVTLCTIHRGPMHRWNHLFSHSNSQLFKTCEKWGDIVVTALRTASVSRNAAKIPGRFLQEDSVPAKFWESQPKTNNFTTDLIL